MTLEVLSMTLEALMMTFEAKDDFSWILKSEHGGWQMLPAHILTRGELELVRDHFSGAKDDL
jgi:hypothetical protein